MRSPVNDNGRVIDTGELDVNGILRDLMDVAKVAIARCRGGSSADFFGAER